MSGYQEKKNYKEYQKTTPTKEKNVEDLEQGSEADSDIAEKLELSSGILKLL